VTRDAATRVPFWNRAAATSKWNAAGIVLGMIAAVCLAANARAAEDPSKYPSRPIHLIIPFAPGGASDFTGRLLQPGMEAFLGQPVVIENRAGAAGNVGMEYAARTKPDGYTMYLGNVGTVCVNPFIFPDLKVKPEKDFIAVSLAAETPGVLIANPKFPPNNAKELVEYVKARQGQIAFASPGSGSLNRLDMELFRKNAGLDMVHIPYKGGAGQAVADILGGHVNLMFTTISSAAQLVKDGKLKALGVTTRERVPALSDVPTMREQGFPESVSSSWQGILVPAGTPRPIVKKLHAAVLHAMADPTLQKRYVETGVVAATSKTPEEFQKYIAAETARWSKVINETGAKPD
jgi:tripartite-type tricarboxylate transporter receptor subunit TctC